MRPVHGASCHSSPGPIDPPGPIPRRESLWDFDFFSALMECSKHPNTVGVAPFGKFCTGRAISKIGFLVAYVARLFHVTAP